MTERSPMAASPLSVIGCTTRYRRYRSGTLARLRDCEIARLRGCAAFAFTYCKRFAEDAVTSTPSLDSILDFIVGAAGLTFGGTSLCGLERGVPSCSRVGIAVREPHDIHDMLGITLVLYIPLRQVVLDAVHT